MRLSDNQGQWSKDECAEVDRKVKNERGMVASKTKDQRGMVASNTKDDSGIGVSNAKVDLAMVDWGSVARNALDQWRMGVGNDARSHAAEYAIGNGCIIRGMPNHGNTCYMNALLQCLLVLGKLRAIILDLGARLGVLGLHLKQLFVETESTNNARHMLDPKMIVEYMLSHYPEQFRFGDIGDSHEFLTSLHHALDDEVEQLNRIHVMRGGGVFSTFGHSIFSGELIQIVSCKSCSRNSVTKHSLVGLELAVPSKDPPARSKPLQVDSCEILDFIPSLFDDLEEMEESAADSHNPEDKEKPHGSVHDEAEHINYLGSIEDCLTVFFHDQKNCENCSKVAELPETNGSKNVEPIIASTNVNTTVDGDQTELPDITTGEITSVTSCDEKDLASCNTVNEKAESLEGAQKAAPSCLPTDKQTDLQDIQDTSTQKQGNGKDVSDDHSAQQVEETQNEQTDGNGIRKLISKLPPVLTIQLKRYAPDLSKLKGYVSFKEILQ